MSTKSEKQEKLEKLKKNSNLKKFSEIFLEKNKVINLISKNDEKFLFEKHIFDSLSIEKFFEKYNINPTGMSMLDIGTGGGFPSVPIAICYPELKVTGLDSIAKKIRAIEDFKKDLNLENLSLINDRAENIKEKYDIVVSRAVSRLDKVVEYAMPLLKSGGYFVCYKSKQVFDEIREAKELIFKKKAELLEVIEYKLPLEENFERFLVVIKKESSSK